jgi:hypothetical protein
MTGLSAERIRRLTSTAASASVEALSLHARFQRERVNRSLDCLKELAEARMTSLREMAEAKSLTQAFEANLAFERKTAEGLRNLYEENVQAWESLLKELRGLYSADVSGASKEAHVAAPTRRKKAATKKRGTRH